MAEDDCLPSNSCGFESRQLHQCFKHHVRVDKLAKSPAREVGHSAGSSPAPDTNDPRDPEINFCADRGMGHSPGLESGACGFDSHSAHQSRVCRGMADSLGSEPRGWKSIVGSSPTRRTSFYSSREEPCRFRLTVQDACVPCKGREFDSPNLHHCLEGHHTSRRTRR